MAFVHNVKKYDMENTGPWGASTSIWFNHCPHHCVGCWNPETWDRKEELKMSNEEIVQECIEGLTGQIPLNSLALLGGDPLSPLNVQDTIDIVTKIKEKLPNIKIICWTGFLYNQVEHSKLLAPILPLIDVLIDGHFELNKRIEGERFGSYNQRCIDVPKTLEKGEIVLNEAFYKDKKYMHTGVD